MDQPDPASRIAGRVSGRVSEAMGGIRDRTAEALSTDGVTVFRALSELRRSISDLDDTVRTRLDDVEDTVEHEKHSKRTTLPRKAFWLLLGAAAGTAAAFLGDPDRGRARRAQLSQQAAARSREASTQLSKRAKDLTNRTKGEVAEQIKQRTSDDVPDDPKLLEQRIRSEVFGHRDDVTEVVLRVDAPGTVALKGTVPTSVSERELIAAVADVDGVVDVNSELVVAGS